MKLRNKLLVLTVCLCLFSCKKHEDERESEDTSGVKSHTVIVYMAADNDLYANALKNINEMEEAWHNSFDGNLIVFLDPRHSKDSPHILKIHHDNNINAVTSPAVGTYPNVNSLKPDEMSRILKNIMETYPSKRYSLILWSHGTGWLPPQTVPSYSLNASTTVGLKSFGKKSQHEMDIRDLAKAIPDNTFETIIFDACFMGCFEVAFELRNKATYFIASPTEILAHGFPYDLVIPLFYAKSFDVVSIGKSFFDWYDRQKGIDRSASIGIVKLSEMKALSEITNEKLKKRNVTLSGIDSEKKQIQSFDRYSVNIFYDYEQIIKHLIKDRKDLEEFASQLKKTILYSAHTNNFINEFEIKNCCGLSCFIPDFQHNPPFNSYYGKLAWFHESIFHSRWRSAEIRIEN